MKRILIFACAIAALLPLTTPAKQPLDPKFRTQFFQLCDMEAGKVRDENNKVPFFVDSYAVRALCVAYDMTGNTNYLNACRDWSDRMVKYQGQMTPPGAYYMHYNRKPGETTNDWYAADSGSIGMAVLATAIRCHGAEQQRYLKSAEKFADLVLANYIKPAGGISDGNWHKSSEAWWCSSGIDGSFLFNLYKSTHDERYLEAALHATDWLNELDLTRDMPFPLSEQGPAMIFYVLENYSAGWPYISQDEDRKAAALNKINWCFDWIQTQQKTNVMDRTWPPTKGWGMKFGGLPFHEYIFAHYLPEDRKFTVLGDVEMQQFVPMVFGNGRPTWEQVKDIYQLPAFMMMSYAERLDPGAIYRPLKHWWNL